MKMDKPNKPFCKILEVIWNRNKNNIRGSKMLPQMKEINIDDSEIKVKNSKSDEVNENSVHKRVKRCLFQEDKKKKEHKLSDSNKSNKKKCKLCVNSLKKRPNNSSPQIIFPRSPQVISTREKLTRNQNTHESSKSIKTSPTHNVIFSHKIVDQRSPSKSELYITESPEIISKQRRHNEYNNLNNTNLSNNDKFNMNLIYSTQLPKVLNKKSNTLNMHLSNVPSKLNLMSSEIILSANKQKFKNKKDRCSKICKKRKINYYTNINQTQVLVENFCDEQNEIKLLKDELKANKEIEKTNEILSCDKINFNSLNNIKIINSPVIETKIKSILYKPNKTIIESKLYQNRNMSINTLFEIEDDIDIHHSTTNFLPLSFEQRKYTNKIIKKDLQLLQPHRSQSEPCLNKNKNKNILFPLPHSSEISVIPATPEHVDTFKIEYSPGLNLNSYVPFIEVDQSPKIQNGNNCHIHIQSIQTPPNINSATSLPRLFDSVASPIQLFSNNEQQFKIDIIDSPKADYENEHLFLPDICRRKKSYNNCSPDCFDSAKKRKKVCKDGLKGKFQDLINRRKSEACIREYENKLSKNYQQKQGETVLLKVIESWKEFKTFVLLCYYIESVESETRVQKVLVTLDNCPKNAIKNSIICIHSPWLTIKSKTIDILLFVGIVHAEVIEFSGSTRSLGPLRLFTNINGLLTTVFQSDFLWKCKCYEDMACQCLGELSVFNYLQYMISY